jgi:hypothetical protein
MNAHMDILTQFYEKIKKIKKNKKINDIHTREINKNLATLTISQKSAQKKDSSTTL